MADDNGSETLSIQELATQMLQNQGIPPEYQQQYEDAEYEDDDDDDDDEPQGSENVHWRSILDAIPQEYHNQVIPTLQNWDRGVNRRFQKIHDEYDRYREFDDVDTETLREANNVYKSLISDPATTWETIGRVFGLSPQEAQAVEDDDEWGELPDYVKERLATVDNHDRMLRQLYEETQQRQQQEVEEAEDEELEEYLEELHGEYGDFDEDYVVGLIAAGVDGEDAVERFYEIVGQPRYEEQEQREYPKVMQSGGGVPVGEQYDLGSLKPQDTRNLIVEALRLSAQQD